MDPVVYDQTLVADDCHVTSPLDTNNGMSLEEFVVLNRERYDSTDESFFYERPSGFGIEEEVGARLPWHAGSEVQGGVQEKTRGVLYGITDEPPLLPYQIGSTVSEALAGRGSSVPPSNTDFGSAYFALSSAFDSLKKRLSLAEGRNQLLESTLRAHCKSSGMTWSPLKLVQGVVMETDTIKDGNADKASPSVVPPAIANDPPEHEITTILAELQAKCQFLEAENAKLKLVTDSPSSANSDGYLVPRMSEESLDANEKLVDVESFVLNGGEDTSQLGHCPGCLRYKEEKHRLQQKIVSIEQMYSSKLQSLTQTLEEQLVQISSLKAIEREMLNEHQSRETQLKGDVEALSLHKEGLVRQSLVDKQAIKELEKKLAKSESNLKQILARSKSQSPESLESDGTSADCVELLAELRSIAVHRNLMLINNIRKKNQCTPPSHINKEALSTFKENEQLIQTDEQDLITHNDQKIASPLSLSPSDMHSFHSKHTTSFDGQTSSTNQSTCIASTNTAAAAGKKVDSPLMAFEDSEHAGGSSTVKKSGGNLHEFDPLQLEAASNVNAANLVLRSYSEDEDVFNCPVCPKSYPKMTTPLSLVEFHVNSHFETSSAGYTSSLLSDNSSQHGPRPQTSPTTQQNAPLDLLTGDHSSTPHETPKRNSPKFEWI